MLKSSIKKVLFTFLAVSIVGSLTACQRPINSSALTKGGDVKTHALMVVPNSDRIDVLDMKDNRIVQTLKTDSRPTSIATSANGRLILVTNYNSGTVSVFLRRDNETFETLGSIGQGKNPIGVVFNPNPTISEAYVVYQGDSKVLVLNTSNQNSAPKIINTIALPGSNPEKIVVSKDGNSVFIADDNKQGSRIITLVRTGNSFRPSYSQPFTTASDAGNVDLDGMIIDDNNRLFIANAARSEIFVFDGKTGQLANPATINLQDSQITGSKTIGPKNLLFYTSRTTGAQKIYVTGYSASVVSVIDAKTLQRIKTIPLDRATQGKESNNPVGIALGTSSSKEDIVYITNTAGLTISIIDPVQDILKRNVSTTASSALQKPLGEVVSIGTIL